MCDRCSSAVFILTYWYKWKNGNDIESSTMNHLLTDRITFASLRHEMRKTRKATVISLASSLPAIQDVTTKRLTDLGQD